MEKATLREEILRHIAMPVIPDHDLQATTRGIYPDTGENLTRALQNAIDDLSERGGGRLSLSAGVWRSGALQLKSGVELHLESRNTVLQFISTEIEENYPIVYSHWEASPCWNFSALLYARDAHDIAVSGPGVLDGGADQHHWWDWHHQVEEAWSEDRVDLQQPDRLALRQMNMEAVPIEERRFGPGHYLRPNFVQFLNCERVLLRDVTLKNSPMWQLNPVLCRSVIVDGVTLSSHGSNNDGCDPESCNGVWIKNCRFDTGDDCISLKSGRDRDGQRTNTPCENVLIENNEFLDGHGGIALGSEMSGGIRKVLADGNRFSSPNLTYALRLKTNARRGGFVEEIMLSNSVMDTVHGAAVHGTMLYEDGRNGDSLPVFRNITIENIEANGGDYGIFLEAFPEVPITGLTLRNIHIDGAGKTMRFMNWQDPVIENVFINGKRFPRPVSVRILGIPAPGAPLTAEAVCLAEQSLSDIWESSADGKEWTLCGREKQLKTPEAAWLRVTVSDAQGNEEPSRPYRVLPAPATGAAARLICRNMLPAGAVPTEEPVTRIQLAAMLLPLADPKLRGPIPKDTQVMTALAAVANRFLALDDEGNFCPGNGVTRQEMASVAMQACGVNYRNASSTTPVCLDAREVANNYATNVARALYFGFMQLEEERFCPHRPVTVREAIAILDRVADFAGL